MRAIAPSPGTGPWCTLGSRRHRTAGLVGIVGTVREAALPSFQVGSRIRHRATGAGWRVRQGRAGRGYTPRLNRASASRASACSRIAFDELNHKSQLDNGNPGNCEFAPALTIPSQTIWHYWKVRHVPKLHSHTFLHCLHEQRHQRSVAFAQRKLHWLILSTLSDELQYVRQRHRRGPTGSTTESPPEHLSTNDSKHARQTSSPRQRLRATMIAKWWTTFHAPSGTARSIGVFFSAIERSA